MTTVDYLTAIAKRLGEDDPRRLLAKLSPHEKDRAVECRSCKAAIGKDCTSKEDGRTLGFVHFSRRLARLLLGIR